MSAVKEETDKAVESAKDEATEQVDEATKKIKDEADKAVDKAAGGSG